SHVGVRAQIRARARARRKGRVDLPRRSRRECGSGMCLASADLMYHEPNARHFRTDVDYGPGWRQARRNGININEDIAPDDVSLLGPPTRGRPRSAADLAAYGYSGQGYPIYGQPRGSTRHD